MTYLETKEIKFKVSLIFDCTVDEITILADDLYQFI